MFFEGFFNLSMSIAIAGALRIYGIVKIRNKELFIAKSV
jgi:hypothetical protein